VDYVLGIVKAPYMTRVGQGPFPSELGGKRSEEYCRSGKTEKEERAENHDPAALLNDPDEFKQGIGLRILSGEYGATTGRPRRTGWLDLVALKHAVAVNGPHLALTKLDVMRGVKKIRLCVSYTFAGEKYSLAGEPCGPGRLVTQFVRFSDFLENCLPNYAEFNGWDEDISTAVTFEELPRPLRVIIDFIEKFTGGHVDIVSTGPERNQVILR
jgi:adenylosuccinate synthase